MVYHAEMHNVEAEKGFAEVGLSSQIENIDHHEPYHFVRHDVALEEIYNYHKTLHYARADGEAF